MLYDENLKKIGTFKRKKTMNRIKAMIEKGIHKHNIFFFILFFLAIVPICIANIYYPHDYDVVFGIYNSGNINSLYYSDSDNLTATEINETFDENPQLAVIINFTSIPPNDYQYATYRLYVNGTSYLSFGDEAAFLIWDYNLGDFVMFEYMSPLEWNSNQPYMVIENQTSNGQNFIYNGIVKIAYSDIDYINGTQNSVMLDMVNLEIIFPENATNETHIQQHNDNIALGTCPSTSLNLALLIFVIILAFIFMIIAYLIKNGIVGSLGSLMLLIDSTYLYACVSIVAFIMTGISIILMFAFIFKGYTNRW